MGAGPEAGPHPRSESMPAVRELIIQEGGRQRIVLIPLTGDQQWDDYLVEAEEEMTREELRKMEPNHALEPATREEAQARMKEFVQWVQWRRRGGKLFAGG